MINTRPSYIKTYESGELARKIKADYALLGACRLCPRRCGINRMAGEKGVCNVGFLPMVSSSTPHFGEERPLVGFCGSGTIFLTNCNLKCLFCQNYDISHLGHGEEVSVMMLAEMMVALQRQGCHNINFVTPTHQAPQILDALSYAIEMGLEIPLVYNSGGYDNVETIKLLNGVFDIYMPDFKYGDDKVAKSLSNAPLVMLRRQSPLLRRCTVR